MDRDLLPSNAGLGPIPAVAGAVYQIGSESFFYLFRRVLLETDLALPQLPGYRAGVGHG